MEKDEDDATTSSRTHCEEDDLAMEMKKNEYLHAILARTNNASRSSPEHGHEHGEPKTSSTQTNEQLERSYKRALSDYNSARVELESLTESKQKQATALRARVDEHEDKACAQSLTLQKYREDIAKKCSYANGKVFDLEVYEEMEGRDLGEELERERLVHITNKVDIERLEQKLRRKNELAGGVSDMEYQNLEEDIKKTDYKIKLYQRELESISREDEKVLQLQSCLLTAIQNYVEENATKERELKDLNADIDEKRAELERMNKRSKALKREIGYDAQDLGEILSTRMVNNDFSSSGNELQELKARYSDLQLQYEALANR